MQAPFSGKSPKNTGKDSTNRQVGTHSAGTTNTTQQLRPKPASLSTRPLVRPSIRGKVDNRNIVGGHK